jgi:uncharacterized protein involved in exopolysaccharide biosynthesis
LNDLKKVYRLIKKNLFFALIVTLGFGILGFLKHEKQSFKAKTEIFLTKNSHKSSSLFFTNPYGAELSNSTLSKDEFSSLIQSSRILDTILVKESKINNKTDSLFNHIASFDSNDIFDTSEGSEARKRKARDLMKERISVSGLNSSIVELEVLAENETLAIDLSKELIHATKQFVIFIGLDSEIKFRSTLNEKIDSISNISNKENTELITQLNSTVQLSDLKIAHFDTNIEVISFPKTPLSKNGTNINLFVSLFSIVGFSLFSFLLVIIRIIKNNL